MFAASHHDHGEHGRQVIWRLHSWRGTPSLHWIHSVLHSCMQWSRKWLRVSGVFAGILAVQCWEPGWSGSLSCPGGGLCKRLSPHCFQGRCRSWTSTVRNWGIHMQGSCQVAKTLQSLQSLWLRPKEQKFFSSYSGFERDDIVAGYSYLNIVDVMLMTCFLSPWQVGIILR